MASKRDVDAAYFTLLRARSDLADLQRHAEWLADEQRRIRRFQSESAAAAGEIAIRLRRPLKSVDADAAKALEARLEVLADELTKVPKRVAAAEAFVAECENELAALRS